MVKTLENIFLSEQDKVSKEEGLVRGDGLEVYSQIELI